MAQAIGSGQGRAVRPPATQPTGGVRPEDHRVRAEAHTRAALAARTIGERLMQEELADVHARLAAAQAARRAAGWRRPHGAPR